MQPVDVFLRDRLPDLGDLFPAHGGHVLALDVEKPAANFFASGIFNLRGVIVPLVDIAMTEGRRPGLLPKHVVVASLPGEGHHDDVRIGIAADEVIGTYSVTSEDLLEQAPENVPHCIGMLRHDDRLALLLDLRRLLEVFPGPSI